MELYPMNDFNTLELITDSRGFATLSGPARARQTLQRRRRPGLDAAIGRTGLRHQPRRRPRTGRADVQPGQAENPDPGGGTRRRLRWRAGPDQLLRHGDWGE